MAKLESEKLTLEIYDIIQYDTKFYKNMYETFSIKIEIKGEPVFKDNVLRRAYELCGGNIESLINVLDEVLSGKKREAEIEFVEPNFSFEIKCLIDISKNEQENYFFPERINQNLYSFAVWVSSGNWNGSYSDTAVGARFVVNHDVLEQFKKDLEDTWDVRKIEYYDDFSVMEKGR